MEKTKYGFKIGDVVTFVDAPDLKMVVNWFGMYDNGQVQCVWFDYKNKFHKQWFAHENLVKVEGK